MAKRCKTKRCKTKNNRGKGKKGRKGKEREANRRVIEVQESKSTGAVPRKTIPRARNVCEKVGLCIKIITDQGEEECYKVKDLTVFFEDNTVTDILDQGGNSIFKILEDATDHPDRIQICWNDGCFNMENFYTDNGIGSPDTPYAERLNQQGAFGAPRSEDDLWGDINLIYEHFYEDDDF